MHEDSYIRGGGPVEIDARRLGRVLIVAVIALLALTGILLAVIEAGSQSGASSLRRHGVPVQATVSSCTGITSGIGMGAEYYQCRGTYSLSGQSPDAVIHGVRSQLPEGTLVDALVVPGRPSTLTARTAVPPPSAGRYVPSIVIGALAVAGAIGLGVREARSRRA